MYDDAGACKLLESQGHDKMELIMPNGVNYANEGANPPSLHSLWTSKKTSDDFEQKRLSDSKLSTSTQNPTTAT